ncbi:MAG: hypothetical protein ACKO7P_01350 [Bacteroidota bacterium]
MSIKDNYIDSLLLFSELIVVLLTMYITKSILTRYYIYKTKDQNYQQNTAFLIFLSGVLFSVTYLVSGVFEPLSETANIIFIGNEKGIRSELFLEYMKYLFLFVILAYTFSSFLVLFSFRFFTILTQRINELREISRNNIGIAIMAVTIIIVCALVSRNVFIDLIENFIPNEKLEETSI